MLFDVGTGLGVVGGRGGRLMAVGAGSKAGQKQTSAETRERQQWAERK